MMGAKAAVTDADRYAANALSGGSIPHFSSKRGGYCAQFSVEARLACRHLDQRTHRSKVYGGDIVDDIAWDMMLDALVSKEEGRRNTLSSLCLATQVSPATASRHLNALIQAGLMIRSADPHDGRRSFVTLSCEAERTLRSVLQQWAGHD